MHDFFLQALNPQTLITTAGLLGILLFVFAESGLFFGFFLPGDSLLFTAGILASQGHLNLFFLLFGTWIAAVAGDSVGYAFGKKIGPKIFIKQDSLFFKKEYAEHAQTFFEKHGSKTIVLARFVPVVRTFAPIIAGVGMMRYRTFLFFNIIGGALWTFSLIILGVLLGNYIPNIDDYIIPIVIGIIVISFIPALLHIRRRKR